MMNNITYFSEPQIEVGKGQIIEDPRDGLTLFGPYDRKGVFGVSAGFIGTSHGIELLKGWIKFINKPILSSENHVLRPPYPGFEAVFQVPFLNTPSIEIPIQENLISRYLDYPDPYKKTDAIVNLYYESIVKAHSEQENNIDLWFVVVPEIIFLNCRPLSGNNKVWSKQNRSGIVFAKSLELEPSLFEEFNIESQLYNYDLDFRNQLKARLLPHKIAIQIIRETTIDKPPANAPKKRRVDDESTIAWNLSSSIFYKVGGKPWKLSGIREGVCYIGLVFKKLHSSPQSNYACCAAQMFLDSGDGMVFRGANGPWISESRFSLEFHLSKDAAKKLLEIAINTYKINTGKTPKEIFIHGKTYFNDEEWGGFQEAANEGDTKVYGIRIQSFSDMRLYRKGSYPILRGSSLIKNDNFSFLWTKGFIPRLKTYPGFDVPVPLEIKIDRGNTDIIQVTKDVLSLTKLNYNSCIHSDGLPVTLRFANEVGEILTAGPEIENPPLQFKYYI